MGKPSDISDAEWKVRVDLAACYRLVARFGWSERGEYASVALGVLVIGGLTVLARSAALIGGGLFGFPLAAIGFAVEYVAWTIGFGAALLVWLRGRRREVHVPALS